MVITSKRGICIGEGEFFLYNSLGSIDTLN